MLARACVFACTGTHHTYTCIHMCACVCTCTCMRTQQLLQIHVSLQRMSSPFCSVSTRLGGCEGAQRPRERSRVGSADSLPQGDQRGALQPPLSQGSSVCGLRSGLGDSGLRAWKVPLADSGSGRSQYLCSHTGDSGHRQGQKKAAHCYISLLITLPSLLWLCPQGPC